LFEPLNSAESVTPNIEVPLQFALHQNYPNPFNSTTTLQIELPQRSQVNLELYNVNGQLVRIIYSGIQNAGNPKFRFDASNLPSGIYFCKMKAKSLESAKNFSEVNKLILLK
jgi:flagellar hook assembly protein FlgD